MQQWVLTVWFVGLGLLSGAPGGPSTAAVMVCHLRAAVSGSEPKCPCGEVCDEDVEDEDVEDRDVEDKDVVDGCDPDEEEERELEEQ